MSETAVPQTKPPPGFNHWPWSMPPFDLHEVEVWREGWTDTKIWERANMHPAMNVWGLWWRKPVVKKPNYRWKPSPPETPHD